MLSSSSNRNTAGHLQAHNAIIGGGVVLEVKSVINLRGRKPVLNPEPDIHKLTTGDGLHANASPPVRNVQIP